MGRGWRTPPHGRGLQPELREKTTTTRRNAYYLVLFLFWLCHSWFVWPLSVLLTAELGRWQAGSVVELTVRASPHTPIEVSLCLRSFIHELFSLTSRRTTFSLFSSTQQGTFIFYSSLSIQPSSKLYTRPRKRRKVVDSNWRLITHTYTDRWCVCVCASSLSVSVVLCVTLKKVYGCVSEWPTLPVCLCVLYSVPSRKENLILFFGNRLFKIVFTTHTHTYTRKRKKCLRRPIWWPCRYW